jgi:hypothetical protein
MDLHPVLPDSCAAVFLSVLHRLMVPGSDRA